MKGGRERERQRGWERGKGRELKIMYMYMYTIKYIFFPFCRELRLQHVRMTRDRKSHEKKVCNKMYIVHILLLIKKIVLHYYTCCICRHVQYVYLLYFTGCRVE